ncbi:hypothetical protein RI367_003187 [Sorochytrium milnesiophthora]
MASSSRYQSDASHAAAGASQDASDFVQYLLQGSGAEHTIDYAMLRKELEAEDSDLTSPRSRQSQQPAVPPVASDQHDDPRDFGADGLNRALSGSPRKVSPPPPGSPNQIPLHQAAAMVAARHSREATRQDDKDATIRPIRRTPPAVPARSPERKAPLSNSRRSPIATASTAATTTTTTYTSAESELPYSSSSDSVDADIMAARPDLRSSPPRAAYRPRSRSRSPQKRPPQTLPDDEYYGAANAKALKELSEFMTTTGLPPLPDKVLKARLPDAVQMGLDTSVAHLMNEFHRRGEIIQQLVDKIDQNSKSEQLRSHVLGGDPLGVPLRGSGSPDRARKLAEQTSETRAGADDLRLRYQMLKHKAEQNQLEAQALREQLSGFKDKANKQRQRAERSFDAISRQHQRQKRSGSRSMLDEMTVDVIDVYESRLEELQNEVNSLKANAKKKSGNSPVEADSQELDAEATERLKRYIQEVKPVEDEFLRLKHTMEQQVNLLQKRLEETNVALARSEQERDLLKLQLLSAKGSSAMPDVNQQRGRNKQAYTVDTREMIRRDKLNYKLKLYKIDELPAEQCRDMLKDICIRLDLNDVHGVVSALEEVAKVLHLVPQMQKYIKQVDEVVWAHQRALAGSSPRPATRKPVRSDPASPPVHKLHDTLQAIQYWAQELSELDTLRTYIEKIYRLLRLREGLPSDADIQDVCLEEMKRLIAFEKNIHRVDRLNLQDKEESAYGRIVTHFCNLFEVPVVSDVFPKMNELYVFVSEVDIGMRRLRQVLEIDPVVKVSTVLQKAADELVIAKALQRPRSMEMFELDDDARAPAPHRQSSLNHGDKGDDDGDASSSSSGSSKSSILASLESLLDRVNKSEQAAEPNLLDELPPHSRLDLSISVASSSNYSSGSNRLATSAKLAGKPDKAKAPMRDLSALLKEAESNAPSSTSSTS